MKTLDLNQMEKIEGGLSWRSFIPQNPCDLALGSAANVWGAAISIINPAAGALFGVAAGLLASYACEGGGSWF